MEQLSDIKRGLEGVVVDSTAISKVIADKSILIYRGYNVCDLAENCSFEEVVYLLWYGELPTKKQLDEFAQAERNLRDISPTLKQVIRLFPQTAHPMDTVRTGVSFLGLEDSAEHTIDVQFNRKRALNLLAKTPSIVATDFRTRKGQEVIPPRPDLSFSENFFHMCFGEVPDPAIVKAFDVSLILYAEHSFNASTFTARVVASSLADIYSAVTAAIGSLKGPLHGGANEQVMHVLLEIGDPTKARTWLQNALREKRKIMGFGHRVYKHGDSRVPTMTKYFHKMAAVKGETKLVETASILAETMIAEKQIHPNLDFPAGPTYYLMGFDIDMFTPIFVVARMSGWTAHVIEQYSNNRLIRPLSAYSGPAERALNR